MDNIRTEMKPIKGLSFAEKIKNKFDGIWDILGLINAILLSLPYLTKSSLYLSTTSDPINILGPNHNEENYQNQYMYIRVKFRLQKIRCFIARLVSFLFITGT